jgi:predicted metal-binding membrane protein|tara:strand:- start:3242 stop:4078 length:837 start_codon:yes stop_codon:yes gene_type:complete
LLEKPKLSIVLEKDNLIVYLSIFLIVIITGLYTIFGIGMPMSAIEMTKMSGIFSMSSSMEMNMNMGSNNMDMKNRWSISMAISMFLMWWLMMIAMMTPSAAPTLLLFHNLKKIGSEGKKALSYTYLFLFGYLIIWAIFSLIACIIHKFFDTSSITDAAMMQLKSVQFSGILLITAGVYQFTPLKNACLEKCRTPIDFLSSNNRKGAKGSFIMGAHHGLFCLGCCWALMALLFVGGVMNLFWITGLALYVLIEKIIIKAGWLDKIMGLILIFFGTSLLI